MLDCEQSLFSQSSLSAAGLERASASCFSLSFASLDFLARVSIAVYSTSPRPYSDRNQAAR